MGPGMVSSPTSSMQCSIRLKASDFIGRAIFIACRNAEAWRNLPGAIEARSCRRPISALPCLRAITIMRSEEHTSELQSLMRISYAVFCLKKKRQQNNNDNETNEEYKTI